MEPMDQGQKSFEMEELINQIPDVMSSKVIFDVEDNIEEIHVLASNKRNPKQISRDIQSALTAKFTMKIDHKKISVAQIDFEQEADKDLRLKINSIGYSVMDQHIEIKVLLQKGEEILEGRVKGINTTNNVRRLVTMATLNCVHSCLGIEDSFMVEDIEKVVLAKSQVMVVAISWITSRGEELLVGSALVKKDEYETVVKATLNAVNRVLVQFTT